MWGIIPAAGLGSRIQPLAFSKELLPVGSRLDDGCERPRAVSEYLIDRMLTAGVTRLCMVISPGKSDLVAYYGAGVRGVPVCYVVQPEPAGLCDAVFRALPLIGPEERVIIGLPDTIWFPEDALVRLGDRGLSFLLFPVAHPERFDAVLTDDDDRVLEIQVKRDGAATPWVWGALKLRGSELAALHRLYAERDRRDMYLGTLINAYLARGGAAWALRAGEAYVDVGTLDGYREAMRLLAGKAW
jgi:glucose-1-phosphate thymidylyltransferase